MKKVYLLLILLVKISFASSAQDTAAADTSWKNGGFFGLNFGQSNFSKWAPGGENSLSLAGKLNVFANYAKENVEWSNFADLNFAFIQTTSDGMKKSDDRVELQSKYSRRINRANPKWLWSVLGNFKSQFAKGYNYPDDSVYVSKWMSPGYFTLALGITYKPVEYFEVFLSPVTGKWTFVLDQRLANEGMYGVKPGENVRDELGAYLNAKFQKDIMTNVNLMSRLELFDNYTDDDPTNRDNIDVNWETTVNMKVNTWITASFTVQVVYDNNVIEDTQLREVLGVGLGLKF